MRNRKKGFTLIELIAVLVILAVIALIVTPLVLNIVKKAKDSASKRSVDAYGKAVELAVATYLLDTGDYPTTLDDLTVEYSGNEVVCNVKKLNEDGSIYLSECTVKGTEVKDSKTEDGWYHYGKRDLTNEEYIDNYGDALTNAVSDYIKTNGSNPTDLNSLTINYKLKKNVACSIRKINYDGSIYLSQCSVDDIDVKDNDTDDGWYHYGENKIKTYNVGDTVTYNGIDFYIIVNSDEVSDSVTLLKAEPLTVEELNIYGADHINKYTKSNQGISGNWKSNGYGGMTYYSSETCGYPNGSEVNKGCTTDYDTSEVKYAVDAWAMDKFNSNDLTEDRLGYKARLITYEELTTNLGYSKGTGDIAPSTNGVTPSWVYNEKYYYWTMSPYDNSILRMKYIRVDGYMGSNDVYNTNYVAVRPVVTILKSAL